MLSSKPLVGLTKALGRERLSAGQRKFLARNFRGL